jgi:hypothetical protein
MSRRLRYGKGPAGTTETLETWSWVRGDLGVLGPGGPGDCLQLTSVVPAGRLAAGFDPRATVVGFGRVHQGKTVAGMPGAGFGG